MLLNNYANSLCFLPHFLSVEILVKVLIQKYLYSQKLNVMMRKLQVNILQALLY